MELSPRMRNVEPYPFEELDRRKQEALDAGRALIDLGVATARDETPAFIRDALRAAVAPTSSYPRAAGLPSCARRSWRGSPAVRRIARSGDRLIPTLGSKEPIFSLAQACWTRCRAVTSSW
jgi:acetylornithine aminotransferase